MQMRVHNMSPSSLRRRDIPFSHPDISGKLFHQTAAESSASRRRSALSLQDATLTRFSAEAEAPPLGRGVHMRHSGREERLLPHQTEKLHLSICMK